MKNKILTASFLIIVVATAVGAYSYSVHKEGSPADPFTKRAHTEPVALKNNGEKNTQSTSSLAVATSSGQKGSVPVSHFIGKWKVPSEQNKDIYDEFLVQDGKKLFYAYGGEGGKDICVWKEYQSDTTSLPDENQVQVECHWDPQTESYSYSLFITYDVIKDTISILDEGEPVVEVRVR